ncbi:MAG: hypothetical protein QOH49_5189 [Acidobacteriota bacterium]|jgi:hypothetical protein|nr:hypothetical protein [Acidobacteriota bacterium]
MFSSWGLKVIDAPQRYFPDYDHIVSGLLKGNEVRFLNETKYDKKSATSGNIYLDLNSLKKSKASILTICLNDPIDTVLMLPLDKALSFALKHQNIQGGDFKETSCLVKKDIFISELKPQVLTTNL